MNRMRLLLSLSFCSLFLCLFFVGESFSQKRGPVTDLPLPRFGSLKKKKVNARNGPTVRHEIVWSYRKVGLPIEIIAEFENWRRIRDWDGIESWIFHSSISSKRTALVRVKKKIGYALLYKEPKRSATIKAHLQNNVIVNIKTCEGFWCRVYGRGFSGFVRSNDLWGLYAGEKIP